MKFPYKLEFPGDYDKPTESVIVYLEADKVNEDEPTDTAEAVGEDCTKMVELLVGFTSPWDLYNMNGEWVAGSEI